MIASKTRQLRLQPAALISALNLGVVSLKEEHSEICDDLRPIWHR
jgi:hypothetical protein